MSLTPEHGYVLAPDEGTAYWFLGSLATVKASGPTTAERLTIMEFVNPAGFAAPLHRHLKEDESFYIISGSADFACGSESFAAHQGDFVFLPAGLPHAFQVRGDTPMRSLQITVPSGFDQFVAEAGTVTTQRTLPKPAPIDPDALIAAAARHAIEILGP